MIPDIKCKSPGEGDLMFGRDPVEIAKSLEVAGAPVISVVTEADHYGGSLEILQSNQSRLFLSLFCGRILLKPGKIY